MIQLSRYRTVCVSVYMCVWHLVVFFHSVEWISVQCLYAFCNWYCVKTITHRRRQSLAYISHSLHSTPPIKSRSEFKMWIFFSIANQTRKCIVIFICEHGLVRLSLFFCIIYWNTGIFFILHCNCKFYGIRRKKQIWSNFFITQFVICTICENIVCVIYT